MRIRNSFFCFFLACSLFSAEEKPCLGKKHMRVEARYTGPKGIGYNKGYTSLDAFFAPSIFLGGSWLPFIDVRGHTLGRWKIAANAGFGLRYLGSSCVVGFNTYYDYRKTIRDHYNQVSAGFEVLGKVLDFRVNGYLPVGQKQSTLFNAGFESFQGNSLLIKGKREYVFKGANAEIAAHVDSIKRASLYFAAGPYYLTGKGDTTWGGQFRTGVELFRRHLRLEGNVSYDHHFKWIGQGQVALNISFGGKSELPSKASCPRMKTLETRAIQPVVKREIIPVSKHKETRAAINGATGNNWVFLFMDNLSSSAGTFESPFPTLLEAQNASSPNEVIYVFGGDGTTTGMDMGITLKDGQQLLGASTFHFISTTKGTILVPPQGTVLPKITSPAITDIVTLANNNTVSGFNLTKTTSGDSISGSGISGLFASQNVFDTTFFDQTGIHLINPTGRVRIIDSSFSGGLGFKKGISVELTSGKTLNTLSVMGNTFNKIESFGSGDSANISVSISDGMMNTLTVSNNTFSNIENFGSGDSAGVGVSLSGGMIGTLSTSENTFSKFVGSTGIHLDVSGGKITTVNVSGDTFSEMGGTGINLFPSSSGAIGAVTILSSDFSQVNDGGQGVNISPSGGTITSVDISGSTFRDVLSGVGVKVSPSSSGIVSRVNISGSTFSDLEFGNKGIEVSPSGGTVSSLSISKGTFSNIKTDGTGIDVSPSGGTITSLSISGGTFSGINSSGTGSSRGINVNPSGGTITSLSISGGTFSGIDNSGTGSSSGINIEPSGGTITTLSISGSTFSSIDNQSTGSSRGINVNPSSGTISTLNVLENTFTGIDLSGFSQGFVYDNEFPGDVFLNVSENTFSGVNSNFLNSGYAVEILIGADMPCLKFANNTATPTSIPAPYSFEILGGTLNRTSDSTGNVGTITTSGSVGAPGSCSQ